MSELLKPPAIPSAILNFFSGQPDFSAVAGDMAEEFQQHAQSAGARAAKWWYWRESFRNAFALTARELYRTPGRTIFMAFASLLAVTIFTGLCIGILLDVRSVSGFFGGHWDPMELVFNWSRTGLMLLVQFGLSFAVGWIAGKLLPGREWAVALMFALTSVGISLVGAYFLPRIVLPWTLWRFLIAGFALRLSGFCLGTLWIRQSRNKRAVVGRLS